MAKQVQSNNLGKGLATVGIWVGIGYAVAHIGDPGAALVAGMVMAFFGFVATVAIW